MCEDCREKKQPLITSSRKSNPKRVIHDYEKKFQKKNRILSKEFCDESSDESHDFGQSFVHDDDD